MIGIKECDPSRNFHLIPYEDAEVERDMDFRRVEAVCQCYTFKIGVPDKFLQRLGYVREKAQ